jgi:type IV secretion system protein VirB1
MIYGVAAIALLAQKCAPEVSAEAIVPLVMTESGGNSLAINVDRGPRVRAVSVIDGAALARRYIAAGYTVDVGLAQINSDNFDRLGVTPEQAFDACRNLSLASTLLQEGYGSARRHFSGLDAISATYSLYNTGTLKRGFLNGYVGRIWRVASALGLISWAPARSTTTSINDASGTLTRPEGDLDSWFIGQTAPISVEVFK